MHEGCCINCAAIVEPMTNESRKRRYETMKMKAFRGDMLQIQHSD